VGAIIRTKRRKKAAPSPLTTLVQEIINQYNKLKEAK